jgi:hypothetical protein
MSDRDGGRVGAVDLDGTTVQQLMAPIAAAEAKRREELGEAKAALRAEAERRAAELGLSAGDCSRGRRGRKQRDRRHVGAGRAAALAASAPACRLCADPQTAGWYRPDVSHYIRKPDLSQSRKIAGDLSRLVVRARFNRAPLHTLSFVKRSKSR